MSQASMSVCASNVVETPNPPSPAMSYHCGYTPNVKRTALFEMITDPEWQAVPEKAFGVNYSIYSSGVLDIQGYSGTR